MEIKVGKSYKTYGGWDATIIWVQAEIKERTLTRASAYFYAIHKPGTKDESVPICHNIETGKALTSFSINEPPVYTQHHPADIIWKKKLAINKKKK